MIGDSMEAVTLSPWELLNSPGHYTEPNKVTPEANFQGEEAAMASSFLHSIPATSDKHPLALGNSSSTV